MEGSKPPAKFRRDYPFTAEKLCRVSHAVTAVGPEAHGAAAWVQSCTSVVPISHQRGDSSPCGSIGVAG